MKRLYFIRHGLSELNTKRAFAGNTDTPLVEKGHEQAKHAGQKAKEKGLSFDLIISSPLQRAHHTALHIAEAVEYPADQIELNELFQERYYGELEGKSGAIVGLTYRLDESSIDDIPNVEKLHQLQARADKAHAYLQSLEHDTVLVVSHGAIGRALYRSVHGLPITKRNIIYENAEFTRFL